MTKLILCTKNTDIVLAGVKVSWNAPERSSRARKFEPGPSKLATFAIVIQQLMSHIQSSHFYDHKLLNAFTKFYKIEKNMKSCLIHSVDH